MAQGDATPSFARVHRVPVQKLKKRSGVVSQRNAKHVPNWAIFAFQSAIAIRHSAIEFIY
jgi:hypothetical protein